MEGTLQIQELSIQELTIQERSIQELKLSVTVSQGFICDFRDLYVDRQDIGGAPPI